MSHNPLHDAIDYHNSPDIDTTDYHYCDHSGLLCDVRDMVYDPSGGVYVSNEYLEAWLKNFKSCMSKVRFVDFENNLIKK